MSELKAISGHEIREDIDYNTRGIDPEDKEWHNYGKELCDTLYYRKSEADKVIAELKERSQWHRQKDKDIFFECGTHWGAEYIIKMKDGTTHLAYGGCDEGGDGSVSTYLHFQDDDYEWDYDDIDIWYEIPDHKIIGNIKEYENGLG